MDMRSAVEIRNSMTKAQENNVRRMYKDAANKVANKASFFNTFGEGSNDDVKKQYLDSLENQIKQDVNLINKAVESGVKDAMGKTSEAVVDAVNKFAAAGGIKIAGGYAYVPADVVNSIVTGQVYEEGWNLSKAIWGDSKKTMKDVHSIIAQGIAENKPTYDIAKDLEKYVSPGAKKDWKWSKVYPGTKKKVDYNAQRLVRTAIQHAYQQSFVRTTINNPFVHKYRWESALAPGRTCAICEDRDGQLYDKEDLPFDHPSGLCTFTSEIPYSMDEIADMIGNWYKGTGNEFINGQLDAWANSMLSA